MLRKMLLIVAACCSLASPLASAQSQSSVSCGSGIWNKLENESIERLGLVERVEAFSKAIEAAQKGDTTSRSIKVVVTDCPVYGYKIRTIKLYDAISLGQYSLPKTYGLYVTAAYIRNTEALDLTREARRQVCLIQIGIVENTQRDEEEPKTAALTECMMNQAAKAGDIDAARWFARELGVSLPQREVTLNTPQLEIDRAIDKLQLLPKVPAGALDALKELRKSFDAFPPIKQGQ